MRSSLMEIAGGLLAGLALFAAAVAGAMAIRSLSGSGAERTAAVTHGEGR